MAEIRTGAHPCPLCGRPLQKFPLRGLPLFRCPRCALLRMDPALDALDVYQQEEYFEGRLVLGEGDRASEALRGLGVRTKYEVRWRALADVEAIPGRLLEVGCGTGTFLSLARERVWDVVGVEVSREAAETGRRLQRLDIRTGTLEEADLSTASFDASLAYDVVEHVPDPRGFLAEIRRLLRPDGHLLIQCPNFDSLSARLAGTHWGWLLPGEHLWQFSPRSLAATVRAAGFAIRSVRTVQLRPFRTAVEVAKRLVGMRGVPSGAARRPTKAPMAPQSVGNRPGGGRGLRAAVRVALRLLDDAEAVLQRVPAGAAGALIRVAARSPAGPHRHGWEAA